MKVVYFISLVSVQIYTKKQIVNVSFFQLEEEQLR